MTNSSYHRHKLSYQAPRRDFEFLLWEQHRLHEVAALDRHAVDALLARAIEFAEGDLAASYRESDEQEAVLGDDGRVRTPDSYPALIEQYRALWNTWQTSQGDEGSQDNGGGHEAVQNFVVEVLVGANPSFATYVGFNGPARNLMSAYGSETLQQTYGPALRSLDASACLCITEKLAGSDLTQLTTWAARGNDGVYRIHGHKWLISAGMHELTRNIYYFVLARTDPAQRGMLGLSCFLVPRFRLDAEGQPSIDNGVRCREVVRKMGLRGCANTHLEFNAGGHETVAFLLGTQEGRGLQQLMMMMAPARISTGIFALGMASCAEGVANRYAQERVQGKRFDQAMSNKADSLPIHQHPDVERMRLDMLAITSGCRALIARLGVCQFIMRSPCSSDVQKKEATDLLDLLLPIVKAYTSDQAWRVCENAIQTMGAAGYLRDYPAEQAARDCKILSIWEGTNHIQSLFLVRDKLGLCLRSAKLALLEDGIERTLARLEEIGGWSCEVGMTRLAMRRALAAATAVGETVRGGCMNDVPEYTCEFLSGLAEVTLAWQLLDGVLAVASSRMETPRISEADKRFYEDKERAARYFVARRLPHAIAALDIVEAGMKPQLRG